MQIHQLPSATSLAQADAFPVSQGGLTKQVAVATLLGPRVLDVDFATTMNVDVTGYDHIVIAPLTANCTINLSGGQLGQKYTVWIQQDSTGGRTVSLGGSVVFGTGQTSYTATSTLGKTDVLGFQVGPVDTIHYMLALAPGF